MPIAPRPQKPIWGLDDIVVVFVVFSWFGLKGKDEFGVPKYPILTLDVER